MTVVQEMGMAELANIDCHKIPKDVIIALAQKFDPVNQKLVVGEWSNILIEEAVSIIFKLPNGLGSISTNIDNDVLVEVLEIVKCNTGEMKGIFWILVVGMGFSIC